MYTIKVADYVFGIENHYDYVHWLCENYIVEGIEPDFFASVSEEEIAKEQSKDKNLRAAEAESFCVCRKISKWLMAHDRLFMHAAVIAVDGEAYAFTAPSGTGKSTHIKLWMDAFGDRVELVNGDKPILHVQDSAVYACGTPWSGKEGYDSDIKRKLKAICFLHRGTENEIHRIDTAEVLRGLFDQLLRPEGMEEIQHFLDLVDRLVQNIPFYSMHCKIDPAAAHMAYSAMKN